MSELVNLIVDLVGDLGYIGIFLMMTIESSFIPFPSEVAMIPAGYLVSLGKMSLVGVFLAGSFGALFGATINYILGYYLGGPIIKKIIHKYGKYIFLKENHYLVSEKFFKKHGSITTFLGRFITTVRQLISIPAGIFKMNFLKFLTYTFLGAGAWNLILLGIGYIAGQNKDLITKYSNEILFGVIIFVIVVVFIYYYINKKISKSVE